MVALVIVVFGIDSDARAAHGVVVGAWPAAEALAASNDPANATPADAKRDEFEREPRLLIGTLPVEIWLPDRETLCAAKIDRPVGQCKSFCMTEQISRDMPGRSGFAQRGLRIAKGGSDLPLPKLSRPLRVSGTIAPEVPAAVAGFSRDMQTARSDR
jgi:hypothetical protein